MIPAKFIDMLLAKTNLPELITEFSELTREGEEYKGSCPFHGGTNRTFSVSPSKQIYKCFKCGKGGNAIRFMVEYKKLDYPAAVRYLADRLNLEIPV
ncbi:CHC2-type zinc finger protein [Mucilaginibacter gracilis]|uniref:CHC2-type zinc finger protein n=1 Tax=Mucilaginibacter gracilis TaxID=423350 RepID=A0A495J4P6_9SPHI|nr:CHC2 zinc finger domain-containing protein [Mucilaginibacter gracilis]RKR83358.1 CHC2-type zinc finger protein [Mucilaginibacter gracilis]